MEGEVVKSEMLNHVIHKQPQKSSTPSAAHSHAQADATHRHQAGIGPATLIINCPEMPERTLTSTRHNYL